MKYAFTLSALAGLVVAQDLSGLPQCGQTCMTNMLEVEKAEELGCDASDWNCLCGNPNFTFGVRDCSMEVCQEGEARGVVDFAIALCRENGVEITTPPGEGPSATGGNGEGGAGGSVSTIYSTLTSDGETITTAVSTTTLGGGNTDESMGTEGDAPTDGAGGLVSTVTGDGSTYVTTLSTANDAEDTTLATVTTSVTEGVTETETDGATETETDGATETDGDDGGDDTATDGAEQTESEPTTTESDGAGVPERTMAPFGIAAAAGLAALML